VVGRSTSLERRLLRPLARYIVLSPYTSKPHYRSSTRQRYIPSHLKKQAASATRRREGNNTTDDEDGAGCALRVEVERGGGGRKEIVTPYFLPWLEKGAQSLYQSDMIRFIGSVRAHHKADQLHVVEVDDTQVTYFTNTSFVGNSATLGGALYISRSCAYLLLLVLYRCPCCDWMID